jgi:hypothetical protein
MLAGTPSMAPEGTGHTHIRLDQEECGGEENEEGFDAFRHGNGHQLLTHHSHIPRAPRPREPNAPSPHHYHDHNHDHNHNPPKCPSTKSTTATP